jgi:hypothetical protein
MSERGSRQIATIANKVGKRREMKGLFVSWGGFEATLDQNRLARLLETEMKRSAMTTCSSFF